MSDYVYILNNLRTIRMLRGYSQLFISVEMGISQQTYSKIEQNKRQLTLQELLQLARILSVPAQEILNTGDTAIANVLVKSGGTRL